MIFPYVWGEYNVLILPPSFPYGGMENPVFTFATPSIISKVIFFIDIQSCHGIGPRLDVPILPDRRPNTNYDAM